MSDLPWIKIDGLESLPKKPGLRNYEYIDCLIIFEGKPMMRPWNCEHECWDTEDGDDHFAGALEPSHYLIITKPKPTTSEG